MDISCLKEVIELLDKSSVAFLEVKTNDYYIKMDKSLDRTIEIKEQVQKDEVLNHSLENEPRETEDNLYNDTIIKSPMVGTFYSSPSPESKAYIDIGDKVKKGDTLCIIEAMKLMNEIQCEEQGEVIEILCKNGDLIEYGQPLIKIRRN